MCHLKILCIVIPQVCMQSNNVTAQKSHGRRFADINRRRRANPLGLVLNDDPGTTTAVPSTTTSSVTRDFARSLKQKPSDAQVREHLRAMGTVVLADVARPRASVLLRGLEKTSLSRQDTTAANGDEETAGLPPAVWYWSSSGRHVFPDPPRLSQAPQRHAQASTMSNIVAQRRLGRALLEVLPLLPLVGWIVVALIGLGASGPDRLMKWHSRGVVDSFCGRAGEEAGECGCVVRRLLFFWWLCPFRQW